MDTEKKKTKKKKIIKALIILVILSLAGLAAALLINLYVKGSTKKRLLDAGTAARLDGIDCILVLGCEVKPDGNPSYMLEDRLKQAYEIYRIRYEETGIKTKIIVSGDHGQTSYDEVNAMKERLKAMGVESSDIFMDHAGFSTYDSMYRASEIFGVKKMVIVSQEYHLYRAIYIARTLGIDAYGSGMGDPYVGNDYRAVREIIARDKDWLKCIFKPKASIMGDKIDIRGDGDVTND